MTYYFTMVITKWFVEQLCYTRFVQANRAFADLRNGEEDSISPSTLIFLPQRAISGYLLSISPLGYSRSQPFAEAQIIVRHHIFSPWYELMKTTSPPEQDMLQHTHLGFISELTSRVPQWVYGLYCTWIVVDFLIFLNFLGFS